MSSARSARPLALRVISRRATHRSSADLLAGATRDQLLALIDMLADRGELARLAHAERERARTRGLPVPESTTELARDYDRFRKRAQRAQAEIVKPAGVLAQIRRDEQVARKDRAA